MRKVTLEIDTCADCPFYDLFIEESKCTPWCGEKNREIPEDTKRRVFVPEWCPLPEVKNEEKSSS